MIMTHANFIDFLNKENATRSLLLVMLKLHRKRKHHMLYSIPYGTIGNFINRYYKYNNIYVK